MWRARAALATAGLVSTLLFAGCQSSPGAGLTGRIVWPKDGDVWTISLPSGNQQKITNLPKSAAATGAVWSPDGQSILYAQFWRRPGENASGSDLMLVGADGTNPHPFADRDAPSTVLEAPQWLPNGTVYYTARHIQGGRERQTIVRQAVGGAPETVVDDGFNASVSADESTLVYIHLTKLGEELRKKRPGESGDGCVLLPDTVFQLLTQPRISPDGQRLVFAGQGDPAAQPAGSCGSSQVQNQIPAALDLAGWLGLAPTPVYAEHGAPADVWAINLDGSGFARVGEVKEDEPTAVWSPDGTHVAIFGVSALYVVDAKGGPVQKLVSQGGYGGLDWTK